MIEKDSILQKPCKILLADLVVLQVLVVFCSVKANAVGDIINVYVIVASDGFTGGRTNRYLHGEYNTILATMKQMKLSGRKNFHTINE